MEISIILIFDELIDRQGFLTSGGSDWG